MAIAFNRQIFADAVANQLPDHSTLLSSGLVFNDPSPAFSEGDVKYRSEFMYSLALIGDDNQRASTGDISAKALSSGAVAGPILRRYDAIEQKELEKIINGVDGIKIFTPQIATVVGRNIEKGYKSLLKGVFKPNGALSYSHQFDQSGNAGGGVLDDGVILDASGLLGEFSESLSTMIMHSAQYIKLKKTGLVDFPTTGQGNALLDSGKFLSGRFVGMRIQTNDILCAPYTSTPTAATATVTIASGAATTITITGHGQHYSTAPAISLSGAGAGSDFAATAVISNGVVTGITITNAGSGYTDGTYSLTFSNTLASAATIYPTYLAGGQPFYLGYQKALRFNLIPNLNKQNITETLRWDYDYCPMLRNVSWTESTNDVNPTLAQLETGSWASVAESAEQIPLVRILSK